MGRLRLMPKLLSCTPPTMVTKDTMVWVTTMVLNGTMDTDTEHTLMPLPTELTLIPLPTATLPVPLIPPVTLARGLLMPSPRLMPMLVTTTTIKDTMDKGIMDSEPTLVTHTPMAETSTDTATVSVGGR